MLRVLLVYPARLCAPTWGTEVWNLKPVLVNLFSYLRQEKMLNVDVLDLEVEFGNPSTKEEVDKFEERVARILGQKDFDIIAISCYLSTNYLSARMVAEISKKINRDSVVVVGGHHASAVPYDFLYKNTPFDFIIIGEGEETLLKIGTEQIKRNGHPLIIKHNPLDLRKIFPLRLKEYKYATNLPTQIVGFELSRGCVFNCSYCPEPIFNSSWRSFSVGDSIKRIEEVIESVNPIKIGFMDAIFGFDRSWLRNLLKEIIKRKIDKVFWALPRIELLEKQDIDLIAKLNFYLDISLESGSEKILGIMGRTKNPKQYLKKCKIIIDYINDKKIPNNLFVILNHPGENLGTFCETLMYLESLLKDRKDVSTKIIFQPFYILPGTPAYGKLEYFEKRYGTFVKHKEWWRDNRCDQFLLATDIAASDELKDKNPFLFWKRKFDELEDLLSNKLSKERTGFDFALEKMIYKDNRRKSFPFNLSMYIPEFLFTR